MNMGKARLMLEGDAKWITLALVVWVLASASFLIVIGPSRGALAGLTLVVIPIFLAGAYAGLRSSSLFGGRKNFTGGFLFLTSSAFLVAAVAVFFWAMAALEEPSILEQSSFAGTVFTVFDLLAILIAAFALLTGARAVSIGLDRLVASRIILALVFIALLAFFTVPLDQRITGLSVSGTIIHDLPWDAAYFVLLSAALIMVAQLRNWYATPAIRIVAFGLMALTVAANVGRTLLLSSGLDDFTQGFLLVLIEVVVIYPVALGLNEIRPRLLGQMRG